MTCILIASFVIPWSGAPKADEWVTRAQACTSVANVEALVETCKTAKDVYLLRAIYARLVSGTKPRRIDAIGRAITEYVAEILGSAQAKLADADKLYPNNKSVSALLVEATTPSDQITLDALVYRYLCARLMREPGLAPPQLELKEYISTNPRGERVKPIPVYNVVSDEPLEGRLGLIVEKANKIDRKSPEARCITAMKLGDRRRAWGEIRQAALLRPKAVWRYFALTSMAWRAYELGDAKLIEETRNSAPQVLGENSSVFFEELSRWKQYLAGK